MSVSGGANMVLPFGGFDLEPHLLAQRAANKAANGMRLPAGGFHQLGQGGAGRLRRSRTVSVLLTEEFDTATATGKLMLTMLSDYGGSHHPAQDHD